MESRTSDVPTNERLLKPYEQLLLTDDAADVPVRGERQIGFRKLTVAIILAFWIVQYIGLSVLYRLMYPDAQSGDLARAVVSALGALLSFGMVATQNRLRSRGLAVQAIAAVLMALIWAALGVLISRAVFALFFPGLPSFEYSFGAYLQDFLYRLWIFSSLSAIILALSYASDVREREQRITALQVLAHSAQLRALRNQLNPHFLFNSLNSIAALMSRKCSREAETMTENLADFLRVTLALDPSKMITFNEELKLQKLYLDIEKVRFPDRLQITVETPDDFAHALVPGLITQPLIENSIKYAVARSTSPVHLKIVASALDGELKIVIEDDGGNVRKSGSKGAELGLRNVAERLRAHYGDNARLDAGSKSCGGFRNTIVVPLRMQ